MAVSLMQFDEQTSTSTLYEQTSLRTSLWTPLQTDSLFNKSQFANTCCKEGEASAAGRQRSVAEQHLYEQLYEHLCE